MPNPFELQATSDESPGLFGLPVSTWQAIGQFGSNLASSAGARLPSGHLANGTTLGGAIGPAITASYDQGRQTALARSQLAHNNVTTQGGRIDNQLKQIQLDRASQLQGFYSQIMNDPAFRQMLLSGGTGEALAGNALASSGADAGGPPGLAGAEGGRNPGIVNGQGYSGQYQFGAGRLADLGFYQPSPGENLKANKWTGTFNIPGFSDVKTQADFLANPAAQQAAYHAHMQNIDHSIARIPGAANYDLNGLRAVAHLGGVGGMAQFIATGGQYNPADANGTRLSDYYSRFSGRGAASPASGPRVASVAPMGGGVPQFQPQAGPRVASAPMGGGGSPAGYPGLPAPVQVAGPGAPTGPAPGVDANNQPLPAGWAPPQQQASVGGGAMPGAPTLPGLPAGWLGSPAPRTPQPAASGGEIGTSAPVLPAGSRTPATAGGARQSFTVGQPQGAPQQPSFTVNDLANQHLQAAQQAEMAANAAALRASIGVPNTADPAALRQKAQQYRESALKLLSAGPIKAAESDASVHVDRDGRVFRGTQLIGQAPAIHQVWDPRMNAFVFQPVGGTGAYAQPGAAGPDAPVMAKAPPGIETAIQEGAKEFYGEKAQNQYQSAQNTLRSLEEMQHSFQTLNGSNPGWWSTGLGADWKLQFGKAINSAAQSAGVSDVFPADKLAAGEDIVKLSKIMGMQTLSSFFGGSREAASIVHSTQSAVPNLENTSQGAQLLLSSFREGARYVSDKRAFQSNWLAEHNGSLIGSDVAFNKAYNPQMYSRRAISVTRPFEVDDPKQMSRYLPGTRIIQKGGDPKNVRVVPGPEELTFGGGEPQQ